jgi:hypothetical protein
MRVSDLDIPAERDFPHGRQEQRARQLVRELSAARRRRRLALTLVPAVIVLLTAATGFTAYTFLREDPSHFESIGCFDRADLGANVSVVSPDGRSAVEQCRDLWQEGAVAVGQPVPAKLAACVLNTGPVGVFPSMDDQTCERLGLADLSVAGEVEGRRFVRMRNAIYARIGTPASGSSRGSSHCVGEERAHVIVRRVLDAHGYSDWTVRTVGEAFSRDRPCADVSFDGGGKEALVTSFGRN